MRKGLCVVQLGLRVPKAKVDSDSESPNPNWYLQYDKSKWDVSWPLGMFQKLMTRFIEEGA